MHERIDNFKEVVAKSIAYFADSEPAVLHWKHIEKMKLISHNGNNANIRFCMHQDPDKLFHSMIILEYKDKKCRKPHKHIEKDEFLQMIEGEMLAFMFDDNGNLLKKTLLTPQGNFAYMNPAGKHHLWIPLTDYVIYAETKKGPFEQKDNISPQFNYIKILRENIDSELYCFNPGCTNPCALSQIKKTDIN
ncbi:WbuC family cupin fold metalloprotein [Candidatus Omnitrophota bacterium]